MNAVFRTLPWVVSLLAAAGMIGMQFIGGGGRPMFPLLVCYLPVVAAGLLALPLVFARTGFHGPGGIPLLSMLGMGGFLMLRTLTGGDPGLRDFELLRLGGTLLFYLVFAGAVSEKAPRLFFLLLLFLSAFLQAGVEFYQFYCDGTWSASSFVLAELRSYYPTTVGTYASKNHLAWLLGDATLFALALACWGRFLWTTRGLSLCCSVFFALGVFLSLSRGGVVALISGLVVFSILSLCLLLSSGKRTVLLAGSVAVLALVALGGLAASLISVNAVLSSRMQGLWMDVYREDLWRAAIHDLGLAPFLGLGSGSFQWSARLMMPFDSLLAHNDFAQLLSEYGLVGFSLVAAFLGIHLWAGGVVFFRSLDPGRARRGGHALWSDSRAVLIGAISVAAAEIAHSFLDFNMHLGANALLAGFCFGLLGNPGLRHSRDECSPKWVRWVLGCALAGLCLLLSLPVLGNWGSERNLSLAFQVSARLPALTSLADLEAARESARLACEAKPASVRHAAVLTHLLWDRMPPGDSPQRSEADLARLSKVLGNAAASDPGDWFVRMRLGRVLARLGDEYGAREAFVGAMQRLPLYALTYQEYAAALRDSGSDEESNHYLRLSARFK